MMTKKDILNNCSGVNVIEGRLLLKIENKLFIDNIKFNDLHTIGSIYSFNGVIGFSSNDSFYELQNERTDFLNSFKYRGAHDIWRISEDLFLCHMRLSRKELKYLLVNKKGKVFWEEVGDKFVKPLSGSLFVTNRLILNEFWVKDVDNSFLYHFILPNGYNITSEILIVKNTLFFVSHKNGNKYKKVIGVDFKNGNKLWELNYEMPYKENFIAIFLNQEDNLCYGLGSKYYQVFDPSRGEVVFQKNVSDLFLEKTVPDLNRQSVYDGRLWFVCGKGADVSFGAMNIKKKKIEFIQNYPLSADDQFDVPVYHKGKLYLKTLYNNTLHVFEKE